MRSKVSFDGHPIHPILVSFPIAFFTGTLICDVAALFSSEQAFPLVGKYLNIAGIAFALLAAIPGIIDWFLVVPPNSSAKKRATKHGLINITVVVLFSIALLLKCRAANNLVILATEAIGFVLLSIAGYMGGTLVYRNQIGVYNRYANKGVWQEKRVNDQTGKIEVASVSELQVDQMKLIIAGNKRIVIGRTKDGYVAFDDRCSHKGGSLAGGVLICDTVQCPWHGSQFNVTSGAVEAGPAAAPINTYTVTEQGGKLYLTL